MATSSLNRVIQHFLADFGPDGGGMTDAELLARFLSSRDDKALAVLVRRHAPMVWGVCRRLLYNHDDAEDAFQATFLVLVRKAADVPRRAVANWLYGVARLTAIRVRATAAKRGRRETQVVNMPEPVDRSQGSGVRSQEGADLQSVLHEELSRLPDHYRGVVILCDLEGMTRKEAARQLGIPQGSVASRLSRARVLLAKRLTQRGVVFSGGSVAAVLAAGSASASAPPALVASTIKAVGLLAAGKLAATGAISTKVAALTEGVVKTMFVTKIKAVLSVLLIVVVLAAAATLLTYCQAAGQDENKTTAVKPVEPAAKQQKEKDKEPFTAWGKEIGGLQAGLGYQPGQMQVYHPGEKVKLVVRVRNVGKEEVTFQYLRHFFIENPPVVVDDKGNTVALKDGTPIGIYKPLDVTLVPGKEIDLYELNLTLSEKTTDPPEASTLCGEGKFQLQYQRVLGESILSSVPIKCDPILRKLATGKLDLLVKNQKNGEAKQAPAQPKQPPAQTDEERMFGNWFIVNDDSMRKGEMWVISKDKILMHAKNLGAIANRYFHRLDAGKDPKQIDITVTLVNGPTIGIIKGIYVLDGDELRLCLGGMGQDRPAAFPKKAGPGEVLILQRATPGGGQPKAKEQPPAAEKEQMQAMTKEEKLRLLIEKVLAAHGGEDKLNKLQFTMTVKHSNGETQHYFVQPPKKFRWETTHQDRTSKRICILLPNGRHWWHKKPNEQAVPFIYTGWEGPMAYWLDYVKFFGPRQALRLKDADHKVALLDEEAKIDGRAAVGVQLTGPLCTQKLYFDKETHLLLKGVGSDIAREVTFSDYKRFDGIPIAQKEHDGHFEPVVTDFRVVEKFDAKLFEQP